MLGKAFLKIGRKLRVSGDLRLSRFRNLQGEHASNSLTDFYLGTCTILCNFYNGIIIVIITINNNIIIVIITIIIVEQMADGRSFCTRIILFYST